MGLRKGLFLTSLILLSVGFDSCIISAQSVLLEQGERSRGLALGYSTGEDISQFTLTPVFSTYNVDMGFSLTRDFEEDQFIVSPFFDYFLRKAPRGLNMSAGARYIRPTERGFTGLGQFNATFYHKISTTSSVLYPSLGILYISDFQGSFQRGGPFFSFNYSKRNPTGFLGFGVSYAVIKEANSFTIGWTYQFF